MSPGTEADESGDDEAAASCAEDFQDELRMTGMTEVEREKYVEAHKKLKRFLTKEVGMGNRINADALIKADAAEGPFDDKPMPAGAFPISSALAPEQWPAFVEAARTLKQAEAAYLAAQQTYAEAVKRLSEEAVR